MIVYSRRHAAEGRSTTEGAQENSQYNCQIDDRAAIKIIDPWDDKWMLSNPAPRWLVLAFLEEVYYCNEAPLDVHAGTYDDKADWVCDGIGTTKSLSGLF